MEINQINLSQINPIQTYNKKLEGTTSFNIDTDFNNFDKILEEKVNKTNSQTGPVGEFTENFGKSFTSGLNATNETMLKAQKLTEAFAAGEDVSVHEVMIASQKSNLSLQMAVQLRNKLLSAYTEINNIKV